MWERGSTNELNGTSENNSLRAGQARSTVNMSLGIVYYNTGGNIQEHCFSVSSSSKTLSSLF